MDLGWALLIIVVQGGIWCFLGWKFLTLCEQVTYLSNREQERQLKEEDYP